MVLFDFEQADTYLMDDPLSAVDPAVGRELFSKVVCGRLKGSTRILVTHQVRMPADTLEAVGDQRQQNMDISVSLRDPVTLLGVSREKGCAAG